MPKQLVLRAAGADRLGKTVSQNSFVFFVIFVKK
jgi:hypothetical protein